MKLGTRTSLLAKAQSLQIARLIEKANPGLKIELVGIQTKGDQIQDIPLQKVEGKDFFVKELDEALLNGHVDLCVHSMKDLSLERPKGVSVAAIPDRADPRDIVIFNNNVIDRLQKGLPIRVGTSSPRRLENIPPFLEKALPQYNQKIKLEMKEIRGNVNTRLSRIHEPESSDRKLDAVVLALAGLTRLQADDTARIELDRLMKNTKIMVLPLSENPTAPAQGALSIECRTPLAAADQKIFDAIKKIHSENTKISVSKERRILEEYGGGCHQRFGATNNSDYLYIRGKKSDGNNCDEIRWNKPTLSISIQSLDDIFDGKTERAKLESNRATSFTTDDLKNQNVFVAHHRGVTGTDLITVLKSARVLTSGSTSWFELAKMGIWVEMSADSLGFDYLKPSLSSDFLKYNSKVSVLTHSNAISGWKNVSQCEKCVATYSIQAHHYTPEMKAKLKNAKVIYWSSFSQFEELKNDYNKSAIHCTGAGKTYQLLEKNLPEGSTLFVFPNHKEWQQWLNTIIKPM